MVNKNAQLPAQAIDFPLAPRVHIAGVTCSSHVSPTTPFQSLSGRHGSKGTAPSGSHVPNRFWDRIAVGAPSECWPWRGSVDRYGYGRFKLGGRTISASRAAYIVATGADVEGLMICHRCDNPRCCNPSHLYAGTKSDNEKDKYARGRATQKGDQNSASKLSADQVENVRALFRQGMTNVAIGKLMGVHHSTISKIRTGASW